MMCAHTVHTCSMQSHHSVITLTMLRGLSFQQSTAVQSLSGHCHSNTYHRRDNGTVRVLHICIEDEVEGTTASASW